MKDLCESILLCPKTQTPLKWRKGELYSPKAQYTYPSLQGIPLLLRQPENILAQWRMRNFEYVQRLRSLRERIVQADPSRTLRKRKYLKLLDGLDTQIDSIKNLLGEDLLPSDLPPEVLSGLLQDKLSAVQTTDIYIGTLFRDWGWGGDEAGTHLKCIEKIAPPAPWGKTLVLGCGSGRLALELHKRFQAELTLALDINPLFLLSAQQLLNGGTLRFCEFPTSPGEVEKVAVVQELHTSLRTDANFYLLLSDGMNPPLKKQSVTTIVTPWFVDIIPQQLEKTLRKINYHLEDGGYWIHFGPFGFSSQTTNWTREEVLDLTATEGFEIVDTEVERIPYLASPYSGQHRSEEVTTIVAKKVKHQDSIEEFYLLPSHLRDWSQPIPMDPELHMKSQQHRILFEVLATIDGVRSVNQIAELMSQHYQLPLGSAREALLNFLSAEYEKDLFQKK